MWRYTNMLLRELLLILPLVVAVTVGQANRGYSYYGTSNVRYQKPQPIYGQRQLDLPKRPMPASRPVAAAPVDPIVPAAPAASAVTESPAALTAAAEAPTAPAPVLDGPESPTYHPVLPARPLYYSVHGPLLPPSPIRPAVPVAAPHQPSATAAPQLPVTEAAHLAPPTETIQPLPVVEQSTPTPIHTENFELTNLELSKLELTTLQPGDVIKVIYIPAPVSAQEPAPVTELPEPIRQPEPILQPEPIREPEPPVQPEPILQPKPVVLPEPLPLPELVAEPSAQPELILQPQPIPQAETSAKPEPILQPQPISQAEAVQPTEPAPQPAVLPQRDAAPLLKPKAKPINSIRVSPPQSDKLVALPPLIPKPQSVREVTFGWHTQPSLLPMNDYTTPARTIATQPPPVFTERTHSEILVTTQSHPSVTQIPGQLKFDFQCIEGNGYYSVEHECDTYVECKNDRAMKYACPDGLHFNPAAKSHEYPCAYPSEVKCKAGDQEQSPKATDTCPNQYGFYSMNDGDCSKFIMCQEGLATIMNCPMGLAFNPQTSSCDWPANVPQCNPNVFKDFTCPEPPKDEDGKISDIIYKYRFGQQCKLYVACQLGHPRLLSCDSGLSFDHTSQSCIDEDYVSDCAVPY